MKKKKIKFRSRLHLVLSAMISAGWFFVLHFGAPLDEYEFLFFPVGFFSAVLVLGVFQVSTTSLFSGWWWKKSILQGPLFGFCNFLFAHVVWAFQHRAFELDFAWILIQLLFFQFFSLFSVPLFALANVLLLKKSLRES